MQVKCHASHEHMMIHGNAWINVPWEVLHCRCNTWTDVLVCSPWDVSFCNLVNWRNACLNFIHLIYFCLFRRHDVISSNAMSKVDVNLILADNVFVWILWWRVGGL